MLRNINLGRGRTTLELLKFKKAGTMTSRDKIQHLLITYLYDHGQIALNLPDGVELEIGITQEGKHGKIKSEDYCWVVTSRENKSVALDSYNLGLNFEKEDGTIFINDGEGVSLSVI